MKRVIFFLLAAISAQLSAQVNFDEYFIDRTLRFDFVFAGNSSMTEVFPSGMREEPYWGGSLVNLTDRFNYGNFRYEVFDLATGRLLYSKGFCTLFQEWQSTAEAKKINRCFNEVATFPFPKHKVRFVIDIRGRNGLFTKLFETEIDPADYFIRKEKPVDVSWSKICGNSDPHKALDLAVIAEGYTKDEMEKFRGDVKKLSQYLFASAPFSKYRDKINIYAIESVSQQSGTDIPGEGVYVNTALNSTYYTFDVERYLTTSDIKTINDYAAVVPHDQIIILINSSRYGGGGVYNYYTASTIDNKFSPEVIVHEFGHGFAGLGDEYFSGETAYEDFYPLNVEPWEANLTTLVDFNSKWKGMIAPGVPVPTPNESKYVGKTGVFEGGGYSAKGIYRPSIDCRMNTLEAPGFCQVCQKAIEDMLLFYIE
ncbi:MAG TPA: M64 family metallopeptidase [Bacteroidales bacterium]|nr:M64 family metallopeptidase [Bacteroidales bacterium]